MKLRERDHGVEGQDTEDDHEAMARQPTLPVPFATILVPPFKPLFHFPLTLTSDPLPSPR